MPSATRRAPRRPSRGGGPRPSHPLSARPSHPLSARPGRLLSARPGHPLGARPSRLLSARPGSPRGARPTIAAVVLCACCAVTPALSAAATVKPIKRSYTVTVRKGALAHGNTVMARVKVLNPEMKVSGWWSRRTVARVVRKGVNNGYQMPYASEGYRCTPTVKAKQTRFTCRLRGADVPTMVTLTYAVRYRG